MFTRLWNDEGGSVISPELCIVGAILVLGLIAGISSVQLALTSELLDVSEAVEEFDFTPTIEPASQNSAAPSNQSAKPLTAADLMQ